MSEPLFRVRLRRPDGTEAYLGHAGCGATDDPAQSPAMPQGEAAEEADYRSRVYGPGGYRYFVVAADGPKGA